MINDETVSFDAQKAKNEKLKDILIQVYEALKEKGYNPTNQIVGYILSGDPTYITNHKDARKLIRQIDRDDLLEQMVESFLGMDL